MENSIELEHISKKFRIYHEKRSSVFELVTSFMNRRPYFEIVPVLEDITFSIKKGETFGIMGNNGSGKTTLLRLISKIYKPDKGTVRTWGNIVPLLQLGIGFQPELTATNNIVTYGILLGFTKQWIKSKVPEILKYAELEKFADAKIKNFSSGMYSRLAFSTAIQVDPDILIVDEVLAVGDVAFQRKCMESFDEIKKKGKTILFVSHDPGQILQMSDRVMVLRQGKIENIGDPQIVVNSYLKQELKTDQQKIN
jgi:lipopolysaccharide transport system ATP-binding protein